MLGITAVLGSLRHGLMRRLPKRFRPVMWFGQFQIIERMGHFQADQEQR